MSSKDDNTSMKCPLLQGCPFFNDLQGKCASLIEKIKQGYCLRDNSCCARHHLKEAIGLEHVPVSLMPQQWEWANQILIDTNHQHAIRNPKEMALKSY